MSDNFSQIIIKHSRGYGKNGKISAYIRPKEYCFNRDRKVSAFSNQELSGKISDCVKKYYEPIKYYEIKGKIIGSNNEENALKEWWRVCEKDDIGIRINVEIKK